MKVKIAVVQFDTITHKPELNIKKAERFIYQATEQGADVVVFPEDFMTAPVRTRPDLIDKHYRYRDLFRELAKKYRIDIVSGSFIERSRNGDYNVSYYIDSSGRVRGKYEKNNLWLPERTYLSSGIKVAVFNT